MVGCLHSCQGFFFLVGRGDHGCSVCVAVRHGAYAMHAHAQEENLNLRLQLKVGDEAEDAENAEILEIKKSLHDMVSRGAGEGQIVQTMDLLTERFADYGRCVSLSLSLCAWAMLSHLPDRKSTPFGVCVRIIWGDESGGRKVALEFSCFFAEKKKSFSSS